MNLHIGIIEYYNPVRGFGFILSGGEKFYFHLSHFCKLVNEKHGLMFYPSDVHFVILEKETVAFSISSQENKDKKYRSVGGFCLYADYNKIFGKPNPVKGEAADLKITRKEGESKYAFKLRVRAERGRLAG